MSDSRPGFGDAVRGEFDLAHVVLMHEPLAAFTNALSLVWVEGRRCASQARALNAIGSGGCLCTLTRRKVSLPPRKAALLVGAVS